VLAGRIIIIIISAVCVGMHEAESVSSGLYRIWRSCLAAITRAGQAGLGGLCLAMPCHAMSPDQLASYVFMSLSVIMNARQHGKQEYASE